MASNGDVRGLPAYKPLWWFPTRMGEAVQPLVPGVHRLRVERVEIEQGAELTVERELHVARERRDAVETERSLPIEIGLDQIFERPLPSRAIGVLLRRIEIEFARDEGVIRQWTALLTHLGTHHTRRDDEMTAGLPEHEVLARDTKFYGRLFDERQRLLAKLLHTMSRALNFRTEQLEIFEGGYTPQGWVDVESEHASVFPIGVIDFTRPNVEAQANQAATPPRRRRRARRKA